MAKPMLSCLQQHAVPDASENVTDGVSLTLGLILTSIRDWLKLQAAVLIFLPKFLIEEGLDIYMDNKTIWSYC